MLARLSGCTVEFLSMWQLMFVGENPFHISTTGDLELILAPALPGWLFKNEDNTYKVTFQFLNRVTVTYYNSHRRDTWSPLARVSHIVAHTGTENNNSIIRVHGNILKGNLAKSVRGDSHSHSEGSEGVGNVYKLDVYFE